MVIYDSTLAIWAAMFTLVSMLGLLLLTIRDIQLQKPLLETGAEITNFSLQSVFGLAQIRSAAAEPFLLLRWLREVNRYALLQLRSNIYSDGIEMFGTLVSPLASLMMFTVVTHRLLANASSSAEFEAILVSFISFNAAFSGSMHRCPRPRTSWLTPSAVPACCGNVQNLFCMPKSNGVMNLMPCTIRWEGTTASVMSLTPSLEHLSRFCATSISRSRRVNTR